MSFDIHISLGPLEVNDHKLSLLTNHEMLRLDVPVEIAAVMYKLQDLKDVDEY